jgi:hypothetical protein
VLGGWEWQDLSMPFGVLDADFRRSGSTTSRLPLPITRHFYQCIEGAWGNHKQHRLLMRIVIIIQTYKQET